MKKQSNTLIALGTLVALSAGTFGGLGTQPVQARGFIRRHPFLTAAGGYLVYHHYHKKHLRQMRQRQQAGYSSYRRR